MKTHTDNETEKTFKHYYRTSQKPVDTGLALLLSKIVHEKCPGAPHDIGLILEAEVANYQAQQLDPDTRLNELFIEADQILEEHPELVEPIDEEQFKRIEKLVEGVEADDLPTRLRELAEENRKVFEDMEIYGYQPVELIGVAEDLEKLANELKKE